MIHATMTAVAYNAPRRDTARAEELVRVGAISKERSCTSKTRFDHPNHARHAAKLVQQSNNRKATIYHCSFCHGWHVTKLRHGEDEP